VAVRFGMLWKALLPASANLKPKGALFARLLGNSLATFSRLQAASKAFQASGHDPSCRQM